VLQSCLKINALIFQGLKRALGFDTTTSIVKDDDVIASRQDVDFVGDQNSGS
jgi:hypothetical protein